MEGQSVTKVLKTKRYISGFLLILILALGAGGQGNKARTSNVEVVVADDRITSELTPIVIGGSPNLSSAKFGAKYFGQRADSDISVLLFLRGTKYRYSVDETFAVILYIDGVRMSQDKARLVSAVDKHVGEEVLHFQITTEEVAWLATANNLTFETISVESGKRIDSFVFTRGALTDFKKFAKSVQLIRGMSP
jgi:hypothetical protein